MERKEFNNRIQKEFEEFKESTLEQTKDEMFDNSFEISLKTYLTMHLQDEEITDNEVAEKLSLIDGNILDELIDCYINNDGELSYFDISEEVISNYIDINYFNDEDDEEDNE